MGYLPVSPSQLWELHHGGMAKNFITEGQCEIEVFWNAGERWGSGADVTVSY